ERTAWTRRPSRAEQVRQRESAQAEAADAQPFTASDPIAQRHAGIEDAEHGEPRKMWGQIWEFVRAFGGKPLSARRLFGERTDKHRLATVGRADIAVCRRQLRTAAMPRRAQRNGMDSTIVDGRVELGGDVNLRIEAQPRLCHGRLDRPCEP